MNPVPCRFPASFFWLALATATFAAGDAVAAAPGAAPAPKAPAPALDPARLPAPKRIVVPKLSGAMVVDGELNDAVWAMAAVLAPFVPASGAGREREATMVRIWYDDTALYLGWTCTDTDIQATFTARDS